MRKRPKMFVSGLLVVLAVVAAALVLKRESGETADRSPMPINFQLSWIHTGSFAGYYAADQHSHYAKEGLAVEFVEGGSSIDPIETVLSGKAQLGATGANHLIKARAEGKPVRVVAVMLRISPVVFITLRKSGITHPRQFAGKTISVSRASLPELRAVMNRFDISTDQYKIVHPKNFHEFNPEEIDVWVGFAFDTTSRMEQQGYEIHTMFADDYGVHNYRNSIFTTDQFINEHPDVVRRFLDATLKRGWVEVIQNPESAGPLTSYYKPDVDQEQETKYLTSFLPLIDTGENHIGWMKPEVWAEMTNNLGSLGLLQNPMDPNEVYTMRFLEEVYGETQ